MPSPWPRLCTRIRIEDDSQIGQARRFAQQRASAVLGDTTAAGRAAIVATELCTNILRHAQRGFLLVQEGGDADVPCLDLLAIDSGPGMADMARSLVDGYSTAGSAGHGLGAASRLASAFDLYSAPGQGCVAFARFLPAAHRLPHDGLASAICIALEGESECGDAWRVDGADGRRMITVVDGLGHGPCAAEAARAALGCAGRADGSPQKLIQAAHAAMQGTRGGAVAACSLIGNVLRYAAVGNISGALVVDGRSRGLMYYNGTVGVAMRRVQEFEYAWGPGALLIMHSDGIATRWSLDAYPGLTARHPSVIAGVLFRDHARGRDDATIVVAAHAG